MYKKIIDFLDGKKTYIASGLLFIAGGLKAVGAIDESMFQIILTIAGTIGLIGVRAALEKVITRKK